MAITSKQSMQFHAQKTTTKSWSNSSHLVLLIVASLLLICILEFPIQVDSQFFTKSSKSIPRMGRRSQLDRAQTRRIFLDNLLDELDPMILKTGEIASSPIDENQLGASRNERSVSGLNTRGSSSREPGLAMRALQTHKLMQHLSSGQPLVPFEKLLLINDQSSSAASDVID